MLELWITFFASATVIVIAGIKLSYFGDIIAGESGIGRTVVGLLMISFATSLPELVTSIKAARLGNPDLVLGNMVGSNLFNLSILFLMDIMIRKGSPYQFLNQKTERTASGSMFLIILLSLGFVMPPFFKKMNIPGFLSIPSISLFVGFDSLLIAFSYAYLVKKVVISGDDDGEDGDEEEKRYEEKTLRSGIIGFLIAAVCIIIAGLLITGAADEISKLKINGVALGGTFVGSLFLAIVTSLPELVATIGALRLNAYTMALGNIFGSNLLNLVILFVADLFYSGGALTAKAKGNHLFTIVIVLAITAMAITAPRRKERQSRLPAPVSWLVLILFLFAQITLFMVR